MSAPVAGLDIVSVHSSDKCSPTSFHEERHSVQSPRSNILKLELHENQLWKYFLWLQISGMCSLVKPSSGEFFTKTTYRPVRVIEAESGKSLKLSLEVAHMDGGRIKNQKMEREKKEN